jgi:hypothetical protein
MGGKTPSKEPAGAGARSGEGGALGTAASLAGNAASTVAVLCFAQTVPLTWTRGRTPRWSPVKSDSPAASICTTTRAR